MGFLRRKRSEGGNSASSGASGDRAPAGAGAGPGGSLGSGGGSLGSQGSGGGTATFRVTVPERVAAGDEFQVYAGTRTVKVRCPPNVEPGQSLQITVPVGPAQGMPRGIGTAASTAAPASRSAGAGGGRDSPNVRRMEGSENAYMVEVPPGARGGEQFPVTVAGQQLMVTCPPSARPGMSVRIIPPPPTAPSQDVAPAHGGGLGGRATNGGGGGGFGFGFGFGGGGGAPPPAAAAALALALAPRPRPRSGSGQNRSTSANSISDSLRPPDTQQFEVKVPRGVRPGHPFALLAGGVRVLVTCPNNASEGLKIRFNLPIALTRKRQEEVSRLARVKLAYDKDGWTRTIRVSDMKYVPSDFVLVPKPVPSSTRRSNPPSRPFLCYALSLSPPNRFQWVRMDKSGEVDTAKRFCASTSAYVRKLEFFDGRDPRMRTGVLSFVPANDPGAVVASDIRGHDGRAVVSYADIADAQVMSFKDKTEWFQNKCTELCVEWNEGHMKMNVRRQYLLSDSMEAVMSLSRKDLRKVWRFEFIGEAGIDAGGLAREWFQLVTEEIFDQNSGLWMSSATNQMCMEINPASDLSCPDDHLSYFRFLGRVMGKALFDRQLVAGHMVPTVYKHMLGWPCQFKDLAGIDEEMLLNLEKLTPDIVEDCCLDFTVSEETMGIRRTIPIDCGDRPGGPDVDVTKDNLPEYLEANFRYRMMDRVKSQLGEILLGFFDVIPEPLLTVFDYQELELLMCGMPQIDMEDWKENTMYSGEFSDTGPDNDAVFWFWEVVDDFDQEMRARLLQFVTGTSGVPSRGFSVLQGNDGNTRRFTIHGMEVGVSLYPRAHTCFNRIDLPMYETKEEMQEKLELAVTMVATGFDIE